MRELTEDDKKALKDLREKAFEIADFLRKTNNHKIDVDYFILSVGYVTGLAHRLAGE